MTASRVGHVGEDLRRIAAARRRRHARLALAAAAAFGVLPLASTLAWKPPVLLVWNASASAPVGLYLVRPGSSARRGDMAVAWTPRGVRPLAAARGYVPANVPLVKRVAAARGDKVCAAGPAIRINGLRAASRRERDSAGRPMPWWNGCRTLGPGEYFLLMEGARSFDGRYFGPIGSGGVLGKAVLLWRR